jgi:hypothetical protein
MYVTCMRVVATLAYSPCRNIYIIFLFLENGEAVWTLKKYIIYIIYIIPSRFVDNRVLAVE